MPSVGVPPPSAAVFFSEHRPTFFGLALAAAVLFGRSAFRKRGALSSWEESVGVRYSADDEEGVTHRFNEETPAQHHREALTAELDAWKTFDERRAKASEESASGARQSVQRRASEALAATESVGQRARLEETLLPLSESPLASVVEQKSSLGRLKSRALSAALLAADTALVFDAASTPVIDSQSRLSSDLSALEAKLESEAPTPVAEGSAVARLRASIIKNDLN